MTKLSISLICCFLLISGSQALSEELEVTGYTHTKKLPRYRIDAAKAKAVKFLSLINPNMDVAPSKEEDELYKELIFAEGDNKVSKFQSNGWPLGGGLAENLERMELAKDLAWLEKCLSMADNLIALLNDPVKGRIVETSGKRDPIWDRKDNTKASAGPIRYVAHLSTGLKGCGISRLAVFILEHPELHNQKAPIFFPEKGMDRKTVGETYLDRARFYIKKVEAVCDFFVDQGSYWAFDKNEKGEVMGWWFNNDKKSLSKLNAHRRVEPTWKASPSNFVKKRKKYGWDVRAVNRALYLNQMFAKTAQGLRLIDKINKKNKYKSKVNKTAKANRYDDIVRNCNNFWRHFSVDIDQGDIKGKNRHFQYVFHKVDKYVDKNECWYSEDPTHFFMDMKTIQEFGKDDRKNKKNKLKVKPYLSDEDCKLLAGTLFSRCFSYDANVSYERLYWIKPDQPKLRIDKKTKLPKGYGDYKANAMGPVYGDWVGRYGTREQKMAFMAKSLEVYEERIRKSNSNSKVKNFAFDRISTWREYRFVHLSAIYQLKKAIQETKQKKDANNKAPVFKKTADLTLSESTPLKKVVAKLSASDPDKGQKLRYWIIGGNAGFCFQLDHNTGELKTSKYYKLDQKLEKDYKLKVMVTDDGYPLKIDTQTLTIRIKK